MAIRGRTSQDKTAPTSKWVKRTPDAGSTVSGVIWLELNARDNRGVDFVRFEINGQPVSGNASVGETLVGGGVYTLGVDTTQYPNGSYNVSAYVSAVEGPGQTKNLGTITIANSGGTANVTIISPAANSTVTLPYTVDVSVSSGSNGSVLAVYLFNGNTPLVSSQGVDQGGGVWRISVSSYLNTPGQQISLRALAVWVNQQSLYSPTHLVINGNASTPTGATLTSVTLSDTTPDVGQTVTFTPVISGTLGQGASFSYDFNGDGTFDASSSTASAYSYAYTTPGTVSPRVTLTDATVSSYTLSPVVVSMPGDASPPTISITSPSTGATVSNAAAIVYSATDNVGVTTITPRVNGSNLSNASFTPGTSVSATVSLDTTAYTNGPITIGGTAYDAAGNSTSAATIVVTVDNTSASPGTPPTNFTTVTKLRSSTAGEQWISPVGIPGSTDTAWPATGKSTRLWAKYGSNFAPIQTEHFLTRASNGSVRHAAGHFKIPSSWGYTANSSIDIVYGTDGAHPTTPDWETVTAGFADNFEVEISDYVPKVHVLFGNTDANQGDSLAVTMTDSKGSKTYSRTYSDPQHRLYVYPGGVNFAAGNIITGANGATARIVQFVAQFNDGSQLYTMDNYVGKFSNNEAITAPGGGSKVAKDPGPGWISNMQAVRDSFSAPSFGHVADLFRDIQYDATGRYRTFQHPPINYRPAPAQGVHDYSDDAYLSQALVIGNAHRRGAYGTTPVEFQDEKKPYTWDFPKKSGNNANWRMVIWPRDPDVADEDYTCTVTVTRANANGRTSEFAVQYGPTLANHVNTGGTTTCVAALPRRVRKTYTARWNDGTVTARSPIFVGHQVYQQERIVPLKDAGGVEHPHLVLRAVVTFNNSGQAIYRRFEIENAKMFAGAVEAFYDVKAIRVGGVNQINTTTQPWFLGRVQMVGTVWGWEDRTRPIAMCDPVHYMHAGLTGYWYRDGTRVKWFADSYTNRIRGLPNSGDGQQGRGDFIPFWDGKGDAAYLGYASAIANEPLHPHHLSFDGSGGARGEKWTFSHWDWLFWAGDTFTLFPYLKALAENGWGGWPWHFRDESATAAVDRDSPPDFYTRWYIKYDKYNNGIVGPNGGALQPPLASRPNPSWGFHRPMPASPGQPFTNTAARDFVLWTGETYGGYAGGSYGVIYGTMFPTTSHSPPHTARSLYLVQPDIWHTDRLQQWAWSMQAGSWHPPKEGEAPGGPNHIMTFSGDNGDRRLAWPMRDIVMAASVLWDGHPHQARWKRYAGDLLGHVYRNVTKSYMGIWYIRFGSDQQPDSNTWNTTRVNADQTAGKTITQLYGVTPVAGQLIDVDLEKITYVHHVCLVARDLEVSPLAQDIVNESRWLWKLTYSAPSATWWRLYGRGRFIMSPGSNPSNAAADAPVVWASEDPNLIHANYDSKNASGQGAMAGGCTRFLTTINLGGSPAPVPPTFTGLSDQWYGGLASPNYDPPGQQRAAMARNCHANTLNSAECNFVYNRLNALQPIRADLGSSDPQNRAKYRNYYDEWLGQLSEIRKADVPTSEW